MNAERGSIILIWGIFFTFMMGVQGSFANDYQVTPFDINHLRPQEPEIHNYKLFRESKNEKYLTSMYINTNVESEVRTYFSDGGSYKQFKESMKVEKGMRLHSCKSGYNHNSKPRKSELRYAVGAEKGWDSYDKDFKGSSSIRIVWDSGGDAARVYVYLNAKKRDVTSNNQFHLFEDYSFEARPKSGSIVDFDLGDTALVATATGLVEYKQGMRNAIAVVLENTRVQLEKYSYHVVYFDDVDQVVQFGAGSPEVSFVAGDDGPISDIEFTQVPFSVNGFGIIKQYVMNQDINFTCEHQLSIQKPDHGGD